MNNSKLWIGRVLLATTLAVGVFAPTALTNTPVAEAAATYSGTVSYVNDGDTIKLQSPVQGTRAVRFLGIDAPETDYDGQSQGEHAYASEEYLKALLPQGTKITVETDVEEKDVYDRLLAHVFKGTLNTNKEMLEQGHAVTYVIWPNLAHFEEYRTAMMNAMQAGRGIWDPANPLAELPFEFRLRVRGQTNTKYVGDYFTKKYVDPANYTSIPVENRVFFFEEADAIAAGFTK